MHFIFAMRSAKIAPVVNNMNIGAFIAALDDSYGLCIRPGIDA